MRDFTLPDNAPNRQIAIDAYRHELSETMILLKEVNDFSDPEVCERVGVAARDANRIAFELRMSGEISEARHKEVNQACQPHLPKRAYVRSAIANS